MPITSRQNSSFVHFFLDIILESESNLYSALKDRQEKLEYYDGIIDRFNEQTDSNTIFLYRLLTKVALFSNNGIIMHELEKNMEESPNTIRRRLRQIPEKMLIRKTIVRTYYYSLDLDEIESLDSKSS